MDIAVKLRNVSYSYDKGKNAKNVLDSVDLTVPAGVIYALLGPSGCGKTTLLKIITGRKRLKGDNELVVLGSRPNVKYSQVPGPGIGYMPQELALYETLTTEETIWLFGQLNLVEPSVIKERIVKISKVLELPLKNKLVGNLSGGQQRRVSLATALIHDPPLLILDEPTVGVDPLLRKQIWSHLINLTATKNTTIIITTHYIEEAREANVIGAMRQGRVLVEADPVLIMSTFKDNNLESCFSKLCYLDTSYAKASLENKESAAALATLTNYKNENTERSSYRTSFQLKSMPILPHPLYRAKILLKRNFTMRLRQIPHMVFEVFVPIVTIVLYCLCIGSELFDVPVAVVNDEGPNGLGQKFVNHIDHKIIANKSYDLQGGIQSVVDAVNPVVIHIGENFTDCFKRRLEDGLDVDNETVLCSSVSAHFDYSNQQIFYILYRSFLNSYQLFFGDYLTSIQKTPLLASIPIDMTKPIYGTIDGSAGYFMVPGIILIISHFMATGSSIIILVKERENGLEEKLWMSGVTRIDILISHVLMEFAINIVQTILLLIFVFHIFQMNLEGSIVLLGIITSIQGLVGMALGFMVSSYIDNGAHAVILCVGVMFANLFTCGVLWPIEGMPVLMRSFSYYLPIMLPNEAFKAIMFKGWGLQYLTVILGFVSSVVWLVIYMALTVVGLKYFYN